MSNPKNYLNAMKTDELRRLHEGQTQIPQLPANHSYKYMKYLEQRFPETGPSHGSSGGAPSSSTDYLIDNLGRQYNDDSIAQLTHSIPSTAISVPLEPITRWVAINSEDRDWVNRADENPYSFGVHLGQSSQYQDSNGALRNIELTINKTFENVTRLECASVVIPNRQLANKFKPSLRPHLLINLGTPAAADSLYGSNKAADKALSLLVPKIPIPTDLYTTSYVEYINNSQIAKDFLTPESALNRLYIDITRPDGYSPWLDAPATDTVNISVIYMPDFTQPYLDVVTVGFFNQQDFQAGDIIKFRGYTFRETVSTGYKEAAQFNQFINRDPGHIIQSVAQFTGIISPPYTGSMYNIIRILAPGTNSQATGMWAFPEWFNNPDECIPPPPPLPEPPMLYNCGFLQKYPDFADVPTPTSTKDNTGKGLNTSTQTTTVLKITYLDKNAGQLVKKIK